MSYIVEREGLTSEVRALLLETRESQGTHVAVVQGEGGVGKTYFVRQLPEEVDATHAVWLGPYDMDDAAFWSLSTLAAEVAEKLDPERQIFGPYFVFQSAQRLPTDDATLESLLTQSRQGQDLFFQCYAEWVQKTGKVPVLILDTLEAIRGLDFQPRLAAWLSRLTSTLVVIATRPHEGSPGEPDPLLRDLEQQQMFKIRTLGLGKFTENESRTFLSQSLRDDYGQSVELAEDETAALVALCDGYPLWLTMAVTYMLHQGMPKVLSDWQAAATEEEKAHLHDAFLRLLLVPYRGADFWSAAIKRLGVVRRRISMEIWQKLMEDRHLPEDVASWEDAWKRLGELPWIRTRSNDQYVTLHDAVAESLAKRLLPYDDNNRDWRTRLWREAADIYDTLVQRDAKAIQARKAELQGQSGLEPELVSQYAAQAYEHHLLASTAFYYRMLSDRQAGAERFRVLFSAPNRVLGSRLRELLWLEMQHFLGGQELFDPLHDVVEQELVEFRAWYAQDENLALRYLNGQQVVLYLFGNARPRQSLVLVDTLLAALLDVSQERLGELLVGQGDPRSPEFPDLVARVNSRRAAPVFEAMREQLQRYTEDPHLPPELRADALTQDVDAKIYGLLRRRGNTLLRISGRSDEAFASFYAALALATNEAAPSSVKDKEGDALTELGFAYRFTGHWRLATTNYERALRVTKRGVNDGLLATIYTNMAYVLALRGHYTVADGKIEQAVRLIQELGKQGRAEPQRLVRAWTTRAVVSRYRGDYGSAKRAYDEAESLLLGLESDSVREVARSGFAHSQAMNLHQAARDNQVLSPYVSLEEMREAARKLALDGVDVCRRRNRAALPAAANAAGRIIGLEDVRLALQLFDEGARVGREMSENWMNRANLVEYATLCYESWGHFRDRSYLEQIVQIKDTIDQAFDELQEDAFYGLKGRWEVLQGHVTLRESVQLAAGSPERLDGLHRAAMLYKRGYLDIARGYTQRATQALDRQLPVLHQLLLGCSATERAKVIEVLDESWRELGDDDSAYVNVISTFVDKLVLSEEQPEVGPEKTGAA